MPDTATMRVTPDQIAAPPDRVFEALVDPGQILQWWGQVGVYRCTKFASDLRRGGQWRSAGVGPGWRPLRSQRRVHRSRSAGSARLLLGSKLDRFHENDGSLGAEPSRARNST